MAVSIRDVAARAGVSVGTASNVLNRPERVNADAVRRVHDAIAELGFVRNDAARQLRAGRSRSVGLVVLDAGNPFFAELARGAQARAAEAGLAVLLASTDGDAAQEDAYLDLFEEQRVTGVLISPQGEGSPRIARLRAHGIRCVLVDREADDPDVSSVAVDDVAGGRLAVEHLLGLGRRRIAVVGGPASVRQVADRVAGAREAVAAVP
uniref:LacI family DNA-binding transcriptional regulator n=1 Tax=Clavibacter sp. MX14-G9D TaxID=3064656 RepID=UPI00293EBD87